MEQENKKTFIHYIYTDKKSAVIWLSIIVLMTVKIYQGDYSFFEKHFGDQFTEGSLLDWYKWTYHFIASFVLFFIIPLIVIKTILKEKAANYGLQIGDWRFGLKASIIAFVIMPIPVYISCQNPEHLEWYPLTSLSSESLSYFALWGLCYLPHYIGWEFFFRGYIGFGFKKQMGAFAAIMSQTAFTTLMHIGKPQGETWGAIVGGIYLGLLCYRTNSIWYAVIFHWYLGMLNSYFSSL